MRALNCENGNLGGKTISFPKTSDKFAVSYKLITHHFTFIRPTDIFACIFL